MNSKSIISLILTLCFLSISSPVFAYRDNNYVVTDNNERIPIPITYTVQDVYIQEGEEQSYFNNLEDIFIDSEDNVYLVDSGNNRIIKFNSDMETEMIYYGPSGNLLRSPRGVFVDNYGDLFIADTGNLRILHLSKEGEFVDEFVRPESNLIVDNVTFDPTKISISTTGLIYIIKGQHFMTLDAFNNFKGYVGATQLGFNINDFLIRLFASDQQRSRLARREPDPYNSFVIAPDNMIYAVSRTGSSQIRKINAIGENIFASKTYGEYYIDNRGLRQLTTFNDITVDKNGIITVLSPDNGRLYQYDGEGNMLTSFGGRGNMKGLFNSPKAVAVNSKGYLFVADSGNNNLQIFKPTQFITNIHEAVSLYAEGRYEQSGEVWQQVLLNDANYPLAHRGIAQSLFKEGKFKEAMQAYDFADYREGYSEAFAEYRHQLYRENFLLLIIIIIVSAVALMFIFNKLLAYNKMFFNEIILKSRIWGSK